MNYRRLWMYGRMYEPFAERVCLWTGGTLVAVLVVFVALSTPVDAQNTDDLKVVLDRMERLERDIRTLNLSLSRGRPVTPPVSGAKPVPAVPNAGTGYRGRQLTEAPPPEKFWRLSYRRQSGWASAIILPRIVAIMSPRRSHRAWARRWLAGHVCMRTET